MAKAAAERALTQESASVLSRARAKTRVDTGALQNSERVEVIDGALIVTAGGGTVDYAWYQHDGTYKMTGTHYIAEALEESAPMIMDAVAREIAAEFS